MPDYDQLPPTGLDRADGTLEGIGTPDDPQAILLNNRNPYGVTFEEEPSSPEIERAEQGTIQHNFKVDWDTGLIIISAIHRGQWRIDSNGNINRVLSARLTHDRPGMGRLSVTEEGISWDNPPDEFNYEEVELNPELEKHPMFKILRFYNYDRTTGTALDDTLLTGPQIISILKNAAAAASSTGRSDFRSAVNASAVGTQTGYVDALEQAELLYQKYLKGIETFYLPGFKVIWSQFFPFPPPINGGCYVENPVTQGGLPYFFWSDDQTPSGRNVLEDYLGIYNPDIFLDPDTGLPNIDWLRSADSVRFERTWFKITRTWLGGPVGIWDRDLYPEYVNP